jgi:hypothetical protein
MATINYYLDENGKAELIEKDLKVLATKFVGKTHRIELAENQVEGKKIKSAKDGEVKIIKQVVMNLGLSTTGLKTLIADGKFEGKIVGAGDYDFKITANNKSHRATLEVIFPAAKEEAPLKEGTDYSFANSKVKALCRDAMTKIESVVRSGPSEKGHGPVEYLGGALHTHVTNTEGIAWEWKGKKMHIVAVGKKNNQNKQQQRGSTGKNLKTAQYDWNEG